MRQPTRQDARRLWLEQLLLVADENEMNAVRRHEVPDRTRLVLTVLRPYLEYGAAFILAISVSLLSLVAIFVTWVMVLHVGAGS